MSLIGLMWNSAQFPSLTLATFEAVVREAFNRWETVANLTFREVTGAAASDIDIGLAPLSGSVVGLASWQMQGGNGDADGISQTVSATVDFRVDQTWSPYGVQGGISLYAVALHEIGHTLGLAHADTHVEIMFPTIYASDLAAGDIDGMQLLYGSRTYGTSRGDVINLSSHTIGVVIDAAAGNDNVIATQGDDTINGGAGNDTISGNAGADMITDTLGNNTVYGDAGNDVISGGTGVLQADGGVDADIVIGGIGDDRLAGGAGNDTLRGDPLGSFFSGDDVLSAGAGTDYLEGGRGADTFIFNPGEDTNYIATLGIDLANPAATAALAADFVSGIDHIDLTSFGYATAADAMIHVQVMGGTLGFSDQGTTIYFVGLQPADLTGDDFLI